MKGPKGLQHHAKSKYTKRNWSTNTSHGKKNWIFRTAEERRKLMSSETIRYCLTNMISNDPHRARMVQRGTITSPLLKLCTLQRKQGGPHQVNRYYLKNGSYKINPTFFQKILVFNATEWRKYEITSTSDSNKWRSCITVPITKRTVTCFVAIHRIWYDYWINYNIIYNYSYK